MILIFFNHINSELLFSDDAVRQIAQIAVAKKTGARGLRRILESILEDALYEYPGTSVSTLVVVKTEKLDIPNGIEVVPFEQGRRQEAYELAGKKLEPFEENCMNRTHSTAGKIDGLTQMNNPKRFDSD